MSFETPQKAMRLANIQSLRGIAALLVVVSHLLIIEQKYAADQILGRWAELGMVGVDIFFVISGFIMVYVTRNAASGIRAPLRFLFARITRIYPLYWLISAALLGLYLWQPGLVFSSRAIPPDMVKSFLLWPDISPPLLVVGWTLVHEMGFYLVFAFLLLFRARALPGLLLVWVLVLALGQLFRLPEQNPVFALLFSPLTYEFIAGAIAALVFIKWEARFAAPALGISLLAWGVIFLLFADTGMVQDHGQRSLYFTLAATLSVYGLAGIKTQLPKWSQALGNWSYALYLTHVLSLSVFGRIWQAVAGPGLVDNIVAIIIMTAGAIGVSAIVYRFCERPLLSFTKKLGGRIFTPP